MKKHLVYATTLSAALPVPFIVLEWRARQVVQLEWPVPLFVFMVLLAFAFFLLGQVVVRTTPARRITGGAVILVIAGVWLVTVIDQMPCFLGVPNCD